MEKIFHFTKYESLKCIIKDNSFRVSNVNLMNDIEEFEDMQQIKDEELSEIKEFGKSGVKKISSELFGERFWNKDYSDIVDKNIEQTHKSIKRLNKLKESCYIASFSMIPNEYIEKGYDYIANISSMWSHYAGKYEGVCIVFNKDRLDSLFKKRLKGSGYNLLKGKVKYNYFYDYNFLGEKSDIDILREKYFTKNYSWNIENEFRYLFYTKDINLKNKDKYLNFKGIIGCIDCIIISGDISEYRDTFIKIMEYKIKVYDCYRNYNSNSVSAVECDY